MVIVESQDRSQTLSFYLFFVPDTNIKPTSKRAQGQLRIDWAFVQRAAYSVKHGLEMNMRIVDFGGRDIHWLCLISAGVTLSLGVTEEELRRQEPEFRMDALCLWTLLTPEF